MNIKQLPMENMNIMLKNPKKKTEPTASSIEEQYFALPFRREHGVV